MPSSFHALTSLCCKISSWALSLHCGTCFGIWKHFLLVPILNCPSRYLSLIRSITNPRACCHNSVSSWCYCSWFILRFWTEENHFGKAISFSSFFLLFLTPIAFFCYEFWTVWSIIHKNTKFLLLLLVYQEKHEILFFLSMKSLIYRLQKSCFLSYPALGRALVLLRNCLLIQSICKWREEPEKGAIFQTEDCF